MQTQADRRTCIQVISRNMKEKDVDKIKKVNNMQKMIAREREVDGHKHTRERVLLCISIYDRVGPGR